MRPMRIVILATALVLTGCAAPLETRSQRDCTQPGFQQKTYKLRIETPANAPAHVVVPKFFGDVEMTALTVAAGDMVEWKLKDRTFTIDFPVGPSGRPESYAGTDKVRFTVDCRNTYCSDPKAIQGDTVCFSPFKYIVKDASKQVVLDPIIVVER